MTDKTNKQKADLQLVRNLWSTYIDRSVKWDVLNKVLNNFVNGGVETDYLVFVMRYVIDNHKRLNYPQGLKYYVDDAIIMEAYKRSKLPKIDPEQFKVTEPQEIPQPKAVPKRVTSFADILGGGK